MAIIIGADAAGNKLKDVVKDFLIGESFEVVDVTKEGQDFVDVTLAVAAEVNKEEQNLGIVIDAYGAGPFMVATKIKGMVAAEVTDERSAYMTRGHNNSRMITMGAEIVGEGKDNIHRYIRLTELIPELLEKVDKGEIALRPAVDISYLPEDIQRSLLDTIEMEQCTPSYAQTRRMRTLLAEGKLTDEAIYAIMQEEKPNQKEKFTISASKIEKVLPQSVKASQREDFILKAIDYYAKHLQRKKEERER